MNDFYLTPKAEIDDYNHQFNTINLPRREKIPMQKDKLLPNEEEATGIFNQTAVQASPARSKVAGKSLAINSKITRSYESLHGGS